MEGKRQTLGNSIIPINYSLEFETNIKTFRFKGRETIKIIIKKKTNQVRLNLSSIDISKAVLTSKGKAQNAKLKIDKGKQQVIFSFNEQVVGNAELYIEFDGINDDSLRGFYRSKYTNNGQDGYVLTTQFEPSDARKAFPCFDEPSLKATFDLSLIIDKDLEGVSNMPIKREERLGSKKKITFQTTPKMSTYLLYIGVGRFSFDVRKPNGLPVIRVCTVPGRSGKTKMALDMCEKFLRFYNDYFGIKYPLPKLDLIALPDFASAAMENWGAITFRELVLLGDEKGTSRFLKQRIAEVIAHELAHMWFGDLVTMEWWDDLWLNESFATFMSRKPIEKAFPKWQFMLQNEVEDFSAAFAADQYTSTHPINVEVNSPDDISEIFDSISYEKGGSILAMLEDYAGETMFKNGLRRYIRSHEYGNATKYDLWDAISKELSRKGKGSKFGKVAADWIDKAGYPIVTVERENNNEIELRQRRFLQISNSKLNDIWPIPIHYSTSDSKDNFMLMERNACALKLSEGSYIKLNYGQRGFYRVRYQEDMLERLGEMVRDKRLDPLDAWGIEKDLFSIARSSRIKVSEYIDFVQKYCMDCQYPLDLNVSGHLDGLLVLLSSNTALSKRLKKLSLEYHKAILERLGWNESEEERNVTTMLRSATISSLGTNDYKPVIERARSMFKSYLDNNREINKNMRSAIYETVAWNGNMRTYEKFVDLYKKENDPEKKIRFLQALGQFKDADTIKKALAFSMSKDVRLQDSYSIPAITAGTSTGRKIIWDWTKENWKAIMKRVSNAHMLASFVDNLGVLDDRKSRDEVAEFFSKASNRRPDIKRAIRQALETIDINARFREYNDT